MVKDKLKRRHSRFVFIISLLLMMSNAENCKEQAIDTSRKTIDKAKELGSLGYKKIKEGVDTIKEKLNEREERLILEQGDFNQVVSEVGYPPGTTVEYYDHNGNRVECTPAVTSPGVQPQVQTETRTYTYDPPKPAVEEAYVNHLSFEPNNDVALKEAITKFGGNPMAYDHASCFIDKNYEKKFKHGYGGKKSVKIGSKCKMVISDYTLPRNSLRMFTIDRCKGTISRYAVASGKSAAGSRISKAPHGPGNVLYDGITPRGFMVIGGEHKEGKNTQVWAPGTQLHGLQSFNNKTLQPKGVVLHKAKSSSGSWYAYDKKGVGAVGHSLGCSAVSEQGWVDIESNFKGRRSNSQNGHTDSGPIMYNFGDVEAASGQDYCGGSEWLK